MTAKVQFWVVLNVKNEFIFRQGKLVLLKGRKQAREYSQMLHRSAGYSNTKIRKVYVTHSV